MMNKNRKERLGKKMGLFTITFGQKKEEQIENVEGEIKKCQNLIVKANDRPAEQKQLVQEMYETL